SVYASVQRCRRGPPNAPSTTAICRGHRRSGGSTSVRPYVKTLQARKLTASAIDLRRSKAERAVPVFIEKVPAGAIAGGHSYGGRVSSMAALEVPYAALILL